MNKGINRANYALAGDCGPGNPQRKSEIPDVLSSLFNEIDRYENLCHRMTDKLSAVVSPCPPQAGDEEGKGFGAPLANELYQQSCKLRRISDDLSCLLDRIEL